MMFLEFIIAGNVLVGPNLCKTDFIINNQLYTLEYSFNEDDMRSLYFEDYKY